MLKVPTIYGHAVWTCCIHICQDLDHNGGSWCDQGGDITRWLTFNHTVINLHLPRAPESFAIHFSYRTYTFDKTFAYQVKRNETFEWGIIFFWKEWISQHNMFERLERVIVDSTSIGHPSHRWKCMDFCPWLRTFLQFLGAREDPQLPSGKYGFYNKALPSSKPTWQWKITILDRKYIFNPGPCSIAMLVYRRVFCFCNIFLLWQKSNESKTKRMPKEHKHVSRHQKPASPCFLLYNFILRHMYSILPKSNIPQTVYPPWN